MQRREFLHAAAAVAGAAVGDVPDTGSTAQQNRLLELADRVEDERWAYEMTRNLAYVRSGLVNAELDALCEGARTEARLRPRKGQHEQDG